MGLDLLDDAAAEIGVQHQLAACAARDDLRGRAAHVDVQKVELVFFNGRCGLAHDLGYLAEDLHAVGCAVGFGFEQADRFVVVVDQRPAGHHLADRKSCAVLGHQRRQGASVKPAIGPKTARWGRVIFPIFRESILSLVLLDNGLQKLYTINKKGTVCEWSASFRHEIKKNDRRLWERGGHFFLLLKMIQLI